MRIRPSRPHSISASAAAAAPHASGASDGASVGPDCRGAPLVVLPRHGVLGRSLDREHLPLELVLRLDGTVGLEAPHPAPAAPTPVPTRRRGRRPEKKTQREAQNELQAIC